MEKYMVMGSCMEYMAHLHVEADSVENALIAWDKSFPELSRSMYIPIAYKVNDDDRGWKHDGYRYESGGYN